MNSQQPTAKSTKNIEYRILNMEEEGKNKLLYSIFNIPYSSAGFTLVEMLVSLFIFSVVMVVATGSLVSIIEANRKAQSVKSVMNNVSFAVDSMARSLRVGTDYDDSGSTGSCGTGGVAQLAFTNVDEETVHYREASGRIERRMMTGPTAGEWLALTAPEVVIERLCFYVDGTGSADGEQPRVLILVGGRSGAGRSETTFDIQTLVSQRVVDR